MWKLLLTTFGIVFVAELGDKTQLATMLMATRSKSTLPVFIGSALALMLSSLIGVLAGSVVTRFIPAHFIQNGAGIAFIAIGILLLLHRM